MGRVAVIGAGISGLSAAYYLSRRHEVSLFERANRLGGHTHTVLVDSSRGPLPVDTGFIVHNRRTYPNFCRLLEELGVGVEPSDMSFAIAKVDGSYEYSSRGLAGFFAQRRNLASVAHYRLLAEILRFNREARQVLDGMPGYDPTLGEYLAANRYDAAFAERYLVPMTAAVWSMPPQAVLAFPFRTLARFLENHGLLAVRNQPQWLTIRGGSHSYIPPITAPYRERIHTGVEITAVTREADGVTVQVAGAPPRRFDDVVFACHGNQILPMLADATETEREVLANFETTRNEACLHTDSRLLPRRRAARASWNYVLGDQGHVTLTYHMNRLQALPTQEDYCVTINDNGAIAAGRAMKKMIYHHPVFHHAAVRAQGRWSEISGRRHTHFCGAWWFYGFHEDGVRSALRVASALGVECAG